MKVEEHKMMPRSEARKLIEAADVYLWCQLCDHEETMTEIPKTCPGCGAKIAVTHTLITGVKE